MVVSKNKILDLASFTSIKFWVFQAFHITGYYINEEDLKLCLEYISINHELKLSAMNLSNIQT